jgi:hypothetical protein
MKYQDRAEASQADDGPGDAARLADANINPATGLATDYLNHFNEAVMLLEMLSMCPDCLDDFRGWRPLSYREHFEASRFKGRDMAIAAYDGAEPPRLSRHLGRHHVRRAGSDAHGDERRYSASVRDRAGRASRNIAQAADRARAR